jgi:hypothetical protein
MEFYEILDQILMLLQRHGRVTYGALKRQFNLRQANDTWNLSTASIPEASLYLASIACTLRLREVYDRINFPSAVSEPPDEV